MRSRSTTFTRPDEDRFGGFQRSRRRSGDICRVWRVEGELMAICGVAWAMRCSVCVSRRRAPLRVWGRSGVWQRLWSLGQASKWWCSACGLTTSIVGFGPSIRHSAQGRLVRLCCQKVRDGNIATPLDISLSGGTWGRESASRRQRIEEGECCGGRLTNITDAFPVGLNVHILGD